MFFPKKTIYLVCICNLFRI